MGDPAQEGPGALLLGGCKELLRGSLLHHHAVFMENGVVVEQAPSQQFFASPKEERTRAFLRRIAHTE